MDGRSTLLGGQEGVSACPLALTAQSHLPGANVLHLLVDLLTKLRNRTDSIISEAQVHTLRCKQRLWFEAGMEPMDGAKEEEPAEGGNADNEEQGTLASGASEAFAWAPLPVP